jgi:hypothetical protein
MSDDRSQLVRRQQQLTGTNQDHKTICAFLKHGLSITWHVQVPVWKLSKPLWQH